jgi:hypothetical protein
MEAGDESATGSVNPFNLPVWAGQGAPEPMAGGTVGVPG